MNDSQLQDLRNRANKFVEELEGVFGPVGDFRVSNQVMATKCELVIAVGFSLDRSGTQPVVEQAESTGEDIESDLQLELDLESDSQPEKESSPEAFVEDDVEQSSPEEAFDQQDGGSTGEVAQVDDTESEPAPEKKKRTARKKRPTKDELLDKMREYVTTGGDRAGLKAYTKVTLGAANTDDLKVGDYAKVITWINEHPVGADESGATDHV